MSTFSDERLCTDVGRVSPPDRPCMTRQDVEICKLANRATLVFATSAFTPSDSAYQSMPGEKHPDGGFASCGSSSSHIVSGAELTRATSDADCSELGTVRDTAGTDGNPQPKDWTLHPAFTEPFIFELDLERVEWEQKFYQYNRPSEDPSSLKEGNFTSQCFDVAHDPESVQSKHCRVFGGSLETPFDVTKSGIPEGIQTRTTSNDDVVLGSTAVKCSMRPFIDSMKLPTSSKTLQSFKEDNVLASISRIAWKVHTHEDPDWLQRMAGTDLTKWRMPGQSLAVVRDRSRRRAFEASMEPVRTDVEFELIPEETELRNEEAGTRDAVIQRLTATLGKSFKTKVLLRLEIEGSVPEPLGDLVVANPLTKISW